MKIVRESLLEFLNESKKMKKYKIIIPPKTKRECVALQLKGFAKDVKEYGDEAKVFIKNKEYGEKELENGELEKAMMTETSLETDQHEAIHTIQLEKYPEMWDGQPQGEKFFSTIFDDDEAHNKYLSMPSEIMAYAFSFAIGDKSGEKELKNKSKFIKQPEYDKYEQIGGEVFELYKHYINEYKNYYKKK